MLSIFFHTLTIDFILVLLKFCDDYDIAMLIICKFNKRNIIVLQKFIWSTIQWEKTLLNCLNIVDWNVSKTIIFDRNKKFMFDLWTTIFDLLEIRFLFFTIYHSQTNEQFERTNQTLKIVFRFVITLLNNFVD